MTVVKQIATLMYAENFDGYLGSAINVRHVAVDDLAHAHLAAIGREVEGLGLDKVAIDFLPLEVIALGLGVGCFFGLFGDGVESASAVNRLLSAGDVGQPVEE